MTTKYTARLTLAVPEHLMPQANQLALITGEAAADVNTFTTANWQDVDGNLYAVCSFVSKPAVLGMLAYGGLLKLPLHAQKADIELARQATGRIIIYHKGVIVAPGDMVLAVNLDPLEAIADMGLRVLDTEDPIPDVS